MDHHSDARKSLAKYLEARAGGEDDHLLLRRRRGGWTARGAKEREPHESRFACFALFREFRGPKLRCPNVLMAQVIGRRSRRWR